MEVVEMGAQWKVFPLEKSYVAIPRCQKLSSSDGIKAVTLKSEILGLYSHLMDRVIWYEQWMLIFQKLWYSEK